MAPSIQQIPALAVANEEHTVKKRRLQNGRVETGSADRKDWDIVSQSFAPSNELETQCEDNKIYSITETEGVPLHPLRLKPLGNVFGGGMNIKTNTGSFSSLPDEVLILLLEFLEAKGLLKLGQTCRAMYAFCSLDELWKTIFIATSSNFPFKWCGSWRSTYLQRPSGVVPIDCSSLFSDVLHRPFQCAHLPMKPYACGIPARNAIIRLDTLSHEDFTSTWSHRPFILTEPVKTWPIYRDWTVSKLLDRYMDTVFRAEAVDWPFQTYVDYMRRNDDESPLYLFDCHFAEKMCLNIGNSCDDIPAYEPPSAFHPDLFTVLGDQRPHHRWLIIGPSGSGSTFHADPNGTSAWNAVIRGSKYWIMFPPSTDGGPPDVPGIHLSPDLAHITAPLSISEYLLSFHSFARRASGCIEAVCHEGELMYVPAGWYHMVVNLEPGIAVTQNFVSEAGVAGVLRFMRDRADQVSGFRKGTGPEIGIGEAREFDLFKDKLQEQYPDVFTTAMKELEEQDLKKNKKNRWDELTGPSGEAGGFSFGFESDGEDEE